VKTVSQPLYYIWTGWVRTIIVGVARSPNAFMRSYTPTHRLTCVGSVYMCI